jgi:hypothetical protein
MDQLASKLSQVLFIYSFTKETFMPGVVAHTCNASSWSAEFKACLGYIYSEILSLKKKTKDHLLKFFTWARGK